MSAWKNKKYFFCAFFLSWAAICVILHGCSGPNNTPEQQVHRFVSMAEEAAEQRDTSSIKKLIAETYSDGFKRTRRDLARVAAGYFLRNKNIHVFTYVDDIHFPSVDRAEVQVYAAMAGQPIPGAESLLDIRADLYRFDCVLARNNQEWLLTSSSWRPALIDDFFPSE